MFLQKGENAYIKCKEDHVEVQLYWENSQIAVTPYCLLVDRDEKLNMIVAEQAIEFLSVVNKNEKMQQYQLNIKAVPDNIKKIVFACIIQGNQPDRKVGFSTVDGEENIRFELNAACKDGALIIGEIYRYKTEWKIRAVGQELTGGKKELLKFYRYSQPENRANLQQTFPKIVVVMDSSVYSLKYFQSGQLQKLFKDVYIASSTINPTREMDVWFYAVSHKKTIMATEKNYQTYIQDFYPQKKFFNGMGLENQELPIILDLMDEYKNTETIIFFISNGKFHQRDSIFELIKHSSNEVFWEFIMLNEDQQSSSKDNAANIKLLPLSRLMGLNKGELHHKLLKPINIWRNKQPINEA